MSAELFEPYPVSGEQIRQAADDTRTRLAALQEVAAQVETDHRDAVEAVEGMLADSMPNAPTDVLVRATVANRQAEFAAGCLELFGLAVDDFNLHRSERPRSVSHLNAAWNAGVDSNFGVSRSAIVDDSTPDTYERTLEQYYDRLVGARTALLGTLHAEYAEGELMVDEAAAEVSTMLEKGPEDDATVQALWRAGALPFYAPLIFTDTDFSAVSTTTEVATALEEYLDAHPELREDRYFQALQDMVLEPEPPQEEIDESIRLLRQACLLGEDEEPDAYYLMWLTWTLRKGLDPEDIVERAEQEDVSMERFDPLRELESIQAADGRLYFLLQDDQGAADVGRINELLHGGTPSITDIRRSNNEWTYNGLGWGDSDVEVFLDEGAAIVATPLGTMMAMPGENGSPLPVDGGGTTWMELFVLNEDFEDPEEALREFIAEESGTDELNRLLHHERLHSAQWAEFGWIGLMSRYGKEFLTQGGASDCGNDFEMGAVADWGGYDECTAWGPD